MPEFCAMFIPKGLDEFTSGFFEAAEFTDVNIDHDIDPRKVRGWGRDAVQRGKSVCRAFQHDHANALEGYQVETGRDMAAAGRDFWYTRNGHGVGFWDRAGAGNDTEILTRAAQRCGELDIYCHNGWLRFM